MSNALFAGGDYLSLKKHLDMQGRSEFASQLLATIDNACATINHGNLTRWQSVLQDLPAIAVSDTHLDCVAPRADAPGASPDTVSELRDALMRLTPWRKGPFDICGVQLNSEWRCNLKWQRLQPLLPALTGKRILDVGCGNGYFSFRMAGAGASLVLGIDPSVLFLTQYRALSHYLGTRNTWLAPLTLEQLPPDSQAFDIVFSMGVLYHRRDHRAHLQELHGALQNGGLLVLETLVTTGDDDLLIPEDRYARMRNVWAVPSVGRLTAWLGAAGFDEIRCLDVSVTTPLEQRSTDWMPFESLTQALAADDPDRTIEGYPAPRRAILLAQRHPD